jgi:hypothetical protein
MKRSIVTAVLAIVLGTGSLVMTEQLSSASTLPTVTVDGSVATWTNATSAAVTWSTNQPTLYVMSGCSVRRPTTRYGSSTVTCGVGSTVRYTFSTTTCGVQTRSAMGVVATYGDPCSPPAPTPVVTSVDGGTTILFANSGTGPATTLSGRTAFDQWTTADAPGWVCTKQITVAGIGLLQTTVTAVVCSGGSLAPGTTATVTLS